MEIKRLDHVAVSVEDIDKSISFYRDVLGFEVMDTEDFEHFKTTYLKVPGGNVIELFDYKEKSIRESGAVCYSGFKHMAFEVDDIVGFEQKLRGMGISIIKPTTEYPRFGIKIMIFLGPDGVAIELCEEL